MFPSDTNFESEFTFENSATPASEEPPFHILLLGNWSGNRDRPELNVRRPIAIDRDNFDEVLRRLKVGLEIDFEEEGKDVLTLHFTELEDFHPDNLFRQVSLFSDLRDVRRRLSDPDSFNGAANEVRSWFHHTPANDQIENVSLTEKKDSPEIDSENLLEMILTKPVGSDSPNKQTGDSSELGRFVSQIVSPYLIRIDENEQAKLIDAVDQTTGELMRRILHHPAFQELESAWRGLYFLVRRVETDVDLKIFILDVSKAELSDNLKSADSLADTFLYRHLIRETIETPGGEPFALIGGNYSFGVDVDDIASLMRLAKLANAADAPFISHIRPEIFGFKSFADIADLSEIKFFESSNEGKLWTALRSEPESKYLGLSPMKILCRLPYGETTDSTETFSFEEFTENKPHTDYLWTNPCFACALLLAQSYRLYGWEMGQSLKRDIENLPLHIFREDGETRTKPCAEIVLTENALEKILEQGLMPLVSFRDTEKVRLARFQSISLSASVLGGKWSS